MKTIITHVVLVLEDRVRLKNLTRKLQAELEDEGYVLEPDGYGYPSVVFEKENETSLDNLFIWLAEHGAAFQLDLKDIGGGPSGLMNLIRNNSNNDLKYTSCSYNGENWNYSVK